MYLVLVRVLPTMLLFFLAQSVVSESALTHYEYCMPREIRTPDATRVFLSCTAYPPAVDIRYACGVARQRRAVAHAPGSRPCSPLSTQQADFATRPQAVALFTKARN